MLRKLVLWILVVWHKHRFLLSTIFQCYLYYSRLLEKTAKKNSKISSEWVRKTGGQKANWRKKLVCVSTGNTRYCGGQRKRLHEKKEVQNWKIAKKLCMVKTWKNPLGKMKSTVTLRWPGFSWRWGRHQPGVDPNASTVEKGRNLDSDKRYSVQKQKDVE